MARKAVEAVIVGTEDAANFETKNVHAIYDAIASHFSSTRYKPWPIIAAFLASIPTGWVGLDSGTGNGKYLPLPSERPGHIWTIGMDMSRNLLDFAQNAGGTRREVVQGNVIDNGWRGGAFDYAISIATIHHLATPERRRKAIERLIQAVSSEHGRILIYVWAIEQDELSKRTILTEEDVPREGKDVFVPWVLNKGQSPSVDPAAKEEEVHNRFYHMFARGELGALAIEAAKTLGLQVGKKSEHLGREGVEIVQDGWERSNYYVELHRWRSH